MYGDQMQQAQPAQGQQPAYQTASPATQAIDWIVNNPSIPLSLRHQFHVMWENVIFGNYIERDILFLMSKFREWRNDMLIAIPEQRWTNFIEYTEPDESGEERNFRVDLNQLMDILESMFFIQLTRGRGGFTLKEINTTRGHVTSAEETVSPGKRFRVL